MENFLTDLACIVFGIVIFNYLVAVFAVWKKDKIPAIVEFQPMDDDEFIEERNAAFIGYDMSVIKLGFKVVGSSIWQNGGAESYFRLYWHAGLKVGAMAVTIVSAIEELTYVEFTQEYSDGSVLNVINSSQVSPFPKLDYKLTYRYPENNIPGDLLAVHTKLRRKLKNGISPVSWDTSRGFSEVAKSIKKECDVLLQKYIVKPEIDKEGTRPLTLWGAIFMVTKLVPPGKYISRYLSDRQAMNALRDL